MNEKLVRCKREYEGLIVLASELNSVNIMDIPFVNCMKEKFLKSKVEQRVQSDEKSFIVTGNPEIVMETRSNPAYKDAVLSADFIVLDGTGILFSAKYKREPLTERIASFDLMIDMLEMANEEGASCYFLGASNGINFTNNVMQGTYPITILYLSVLIISKQFQ